jgi:hypothetical protein
LEKEDANDRTGHDAWWLLRNMQLNTGCHLIMARGDVSCDNISQDSSASQPSRGHCCGLKGWGMKRKAALLGQM